MLKKSIKKAIKWVVDKFVGSELAQDANAVSGERYITDGMPELAREASREGIVMLKNDGVLPLAKGSKVAVFGRCQCDYHYVGYGSGGDVHAPYLTNLYNALAQAETTGKLHLNKDVLTHYLAWRQTKEAEIDPGFWGHWPMHYPEMPIGNLAEIAAQDSDVAIVIIGRAAGEDRENVLDAGSYYLTDTEKDMLHKVAATFAKTIVVMDVGNVVDLKEVSATNPSAILYAWLGGMESGNALVDVLTGVVSPSGRLSSTIAIDYEDYPSSASFGGEDYNNYTEDVYVGYRYFETFAQDRVLYPFLHGLTYSTFSRTATATHASDKTTIAATVKNTGKTAAKDVVSIFVECPSGKLGKPSRVLVGFAKTAELSPGEEETVTLDISPYDYASYDASISSYVLEEGDYTFCLGGSVREAQPFFRYSIDKTIIVSTHRNVLKVAEPFDVLVNDNGRAMYKPVYVADYNIEERVLSSLPTPTASPKGRYSYADVTEGRIDVESFVSSLTLTELEGLTRGIGYMNSELGVKGNAGSFCATTKALLSRGLPPIITTDGPAGIRVSYYTSLLPCGTALASSFNTSLVKKLYKKVGEEMGHYKTDFLLAPGINIHRSPLCGRNFEYFSEDPLVTGKMASAVVQGLQSMGVGACPKHFACNNQEEKRFVNDSRVSERALREIYLKGFEICVKESAPLAIMTSYNKINGIYSYYNYDLATEVLRREWGYQGMVMTDWWMRRATSPYSSRVYDNAYRVRAGVDVLMPGNFSKLGRKYILDKSLLKHVDKAGGITRAEIETAAARVLKTALALKK